MQAVANQTQGIGRCPEATVGGNQLRLRGVPIGLGVHQGAVHVPQHGLGQQVLSIRCLTCENI